jgi:ribosomal protein S18 acetylase RimI-like enzyme
MMASAIPEISEARTAAQLQQVRGLFREYFVEIPAEYCFQGFEREIEGLPGQYAPPAGSLLLATISGESAGCVGLRPFPLPRVCEMKHLYVRPSFRGYKLGFLLVQEVINQARSKSYEYLRLDTHPPSMRAAVALYERMGFVTVDSSPLPAVPGLQYMQLKL